MDRLDGPQFPGSRDHFPFLTVVLCFFVVGEWRKDEISGGDIIYWNLKLK